MYLNIIENYKSVNSFLTGSSLTDYLIKQCIWREKGIDCSVARTEKGKPLIRVNEQECGLHVSVSHSGSTFACIIADFNIGLDIQHERDVDAVRLSERYFTDEEAELVRNDQKEFFRLWARKEAYSKFMGDGLATVMGKNDVLNRSDVVFRDMVSVDETGTSCHMAVCAGEGADINEIQISSRKQNR